MKRFQLALMRKAAVVMAAGMVLQVGGCDQAAVNEAVSGLTTSILNSMITAFVSGLVGLT